MTCINFGECENKQAVTENVEIWDENITQRLLQESLSPRYVATKIGFEGEAQEVEIGILSPLKINKEKTKQKQKNTNKNKNKILVCQTVWRYSI